MDTVAEYCVHSDRLLVCLVMNEGLPCGVVALAGGATSTDCDANWQSGEMGLAAVWCVVLCWRSVVAIKMESKAGMEQKKPRHSFYF